jgi:hypothetical protein
MNIMMMLMTWNWMNIMTMLMTWKWMNIMMMLMTWKWMNIMMMSMTWKWMNIMMMSVDYNRQTSTSFAVYETMKKRHSKHPPLKVLTLSFRTSKKSCEHGHKTKEISAVIC